MFFENENMVNIGLFFILLNLIVAIFAVCVDDRKFKMINILQRFHIIIIFALMGCLLFPLGTVVLAMMAYANYKPLYEKVR